MFDSYKVESAIFVNNQRTMVEAVLFNDDDGFIEVIGEVETGDPVWSIVMKYFTVDQVGKMTDEKRERERDALKAMAIEYGLAEGYIYDPKSEKATNRMGIEEIFDLPNDQRGQDLLFEIKLRIFETEEALNSTNEELQQRLRECNSAIEAIWIYGNMLGLTE